VPVLKSPAPVPSTFLVLGVLIGVASGCGAAKATPKPKDPASITANNIRLAESYFRAGKINEALSVLDKAVSEQPNNAGLRNYYGQLSFLAGRNSEAEAAFTKALELDPHLTDARNNLGALYDATGRKNEAEQQFLKVLSDSAYGSPEKAHLNLGILYSSSGRQPEAIEHLRKAVEINPKFYRGHYELASVLDKAGHLEEAAREYEVAAPEYRENGEYQYRIGLAYMKLDQAEKAREHFSLCQELSPGSESASKAFDLMKMLP
jgi:type IV pilus biogenesis/stability protein PilW